MSKIKPMTEAELRANLPEIADQLAWEDADPQTKKEITANIKAGEPVMKDFKKKTGLVDTYDLSAIRYYYSPLSREIVDHHLYWLSRVKNEAVIEDLIFNLANTKVKYDGTILTKLFERIADESFRWSIGSTIQQSKPEKINEWVIATVQKRKYGNARQMMFMALPDYASKEEANRILKDHFEDAPSHCASALRRIGQEPEYTFLQKKLKEYEERLENTLNANIPREEKNDVKGRLKHIIKSINSAIRMIERRIKK